MENKINKVLCRIFACIMTAVAGVLLLFSLVSTTHVTGVDTVFYVGDSAWLHVMVLGALTGIGIILKKRKVGVPWAVIIIAGAAVLVLLTLYVHQAGLHPKFDQRRVLQIAEDAGNGVYDEFLPGGYLDVYPQQNGVVLLYEFVYRRFEYMDYMVIQYLNVLMMGIFVAGFGVLIRMLLPGHEKAAVAGTIFFLPFWGYVTQIYGNLPAMAFGVWAMILTVRYCRKERLWQALGMSLLMMIAVIMKENFLILLIALEIIILFHVITKKRLKLLIGALLCVVFVFAGVKGTDALMRSQTGIAQDQGVSMLSYYAMGMHEHAERGAGWYDGYNEEAYEAGGYNTAKASEVAKGDIRKSYQNFREHPAYFVGFYIRKAACMWNDPTCDSIAMQWGRWSDREPGALAKPVISEGDFTAFLEHIMNLCWTPLLFGVLVYFISAFKREDRFEYYLPAIFFIGGFLFHFFIWETGSYYTFYYMIMLIPYAVYGWSIFCELIPKLETKRLVLLAGAAVCLALILSLPQTASLLTLNRDNARYAEYLLTLPV